MQAICLVCHREYEGEPDPLDHAMAAIWDEPLQLDGLCESCRREDEEWCSQAAPFEEKDGRIQSRPPR
jgi:hypothetical protein